MSLANQSKALAQSGANFRREIFSVDQTGQPQTFQPKDSDGDPIQCYFTPVRDQQQLDEANMKEQHDTILRIDKATGFEPRLGQVIVLLRARNGGGDLTVRFEEFGHTAFNTEFVLGCANIF
jgi:hypothetical protein